MIECLEEDLRHMGGAEAFQELPFVNEDGEIDLRDEGIQSVVKAIQKVTENLYDVPYDELHPADRKYIIGIVIYYSKRS